MAEFADLDTALTAVRGNFALIAAAIADEECGGQIRDALACSILHELMPICRSIQGSDWGYNVKVLGGATSVLALQGHYPELSAL